MGCSKSTKRKAFETIVVQKLTLSSFVPNENFNQRVKDYNILQFQLISP